MQSEKRTRNLSNHQVQRRLVVRIALHWVLFLVTSLAVLCVWQLLISGDPFDLFSGGLGKTLEQSAPVFIVLTVLIPLFVWDTIKLSNRVVCPINRLESAMKRLANGEAVKPMACRVTDPWHPLFSEMNRILERFDCVDRSAGQGESITTDVVEAETELAV